MITKRVFILHNYYCRNYDEGFVEEEDYRYSFVEYEENGHSITWWDNSCTNVYRVYE
jgi:hypothetical protein